MRRRKSRARALLLLHCMHMCMYVRAPPPPRQGVGVGGPRQTAALGAPHSSLTHALLTHKTPLSGYTTAGRQRIARTQPRAATIITPMPPNGAVAAAGGGGQRRGATAAANTAPPPAPAPPRAPRRPPPPRPRPAPRRRPPPARRALLAALLAALALPRAARAPDAGAAWEDAKGVCSTSNYGNAASGCEATRELDFLAASADADPLWNDLFGGAEITRAPTTDWRERPQWAAPGQAAQMQWWRSRARELCFGRVRRGVGGAGGEQGKGGGSVCAGVCETLLLPLTALLLPLAHNPGESRQQLPLYPQNNTTRATPWRRAGTARTKQQPRRTARRAPPALWASSKPRSAPARPPAAGRRRPTSTRRRAAASAAARGVCGTSRGMARTGEPVGLFFIFSFAPAGCSLLAALSRRRLGASSLPWRCNRWRPNPPV